MTIALGSASATLMLADFVNVDASGKVNIIGGGVQFLGHDPSNGMSAAFSVYVNITVSLPQFEETAANVEVVLVDGDGQAVTLETEQGNNTVRFVQEVDFRINGDGSSMPPIGFPSTSNIVLNFPQGLPLAPNSAYEWLVFVDSQRLTSTSMFIPVAE